jgi:hypothetical protein
MPGSRVMGVAMTIVVAWERRLGTYSEIVFCSDSRLTGGGNIDVCQKIFALPREDAAIGFCGSTLIAYPLIQQFSSYIRNYKKNVDRALDGSELPSRFCALTNNFIESYIDAVDLSNELKETSFVLGYFSWRLNRPFIYRISYDSGHRKYVPVMSGFPKSVSNALYKSGQFALIGDLRHKYIQIVYESTKNRRFTRFDMEPFQALVSMLSDETYVNRKNEFRGVIGGAPQLLKLYPFLRAVDFAVYWPNKSQGRLYVNGRATFDYEKIHVPHLDASTLELYYPLGDIGGKETN